MQKYEYNIKMKRKKAFNDIIIGEIWKNKMEKNVKIIHEKTVIIGAGMSGIAAAVWSSQQ